MLGEEVENLTAYTYHKNVKKFVKHVFYIKSSFSFIKSELFNPLTTNNINAAKHSEICLHIQHYLWIRKKGLNVNKQHSYQSNVAMEFPTTSTII